MNTLMIKKKKPLKTKNPTVTGSSLITLLLLPPP